MGELSALFPYFRPYRWRVVRGMLAILAGVVVGLATPLVVGAAVDAFRREPTSGTLLGYAGFLVGLTAVRGLFSYAQRMTLVPVSRDVEVDLRNDFFRSLERQPPEFFHRHATGDLMARATNDLQAVRLLCGPAIMYSTNTVVTAAGSLVFMFAIHPKLATVALAPMPLVALVTKVFGQKIHHLFERVQEQFSDLTTRVQENLAGLRVVRAYAQEEHEEEKFAWLNDEYVERNRRLVLWTSAFHPLLQTLGGFGFVAVLGYGGSLVVAGEITIGQFVTFNFFLLKLMWPMIAIGWVINLAQRGAASFGRIRRILSTEPAISDLPSARHDHRVRGDVVVRGLDVSFGAGEPALAEVDLDVAAGETLALVGRTGAGKSTLLSVLARLVDPPPASVFLDGIDVRELGLESLRAAMSVVPQESFLFSVTVGENIALARPDAASSEILAAAELAGLGRDLEGFPDGLDTVVGERGITLSGGQKQRVALARALVRDSPILLLDDCLSAVDTQTEEEILGNLRRELSDRTVFMVSHRVSAVRHADQIVVLERGRVAERGTHDQLLDRGGRYADLARRQQLEEELAALP